MSYTKTLVPRSPSGINTLGECDIFYPLQTKIADWYPTKKPIPHPPPPHPPPPPPPPPPAASTAGQEEADDDEKQGVLPGNVGPPIPMDSLPPPPGNAIFFNYLFHF